MLVQWCFIFDCLIWLISIWETILSSSNVCSFPLYRQPTNILKYFSDFYRTCRSRKFHCFILIISNLSRIFRLRGVHKMFEGGPIFRGWNEFLLLGKALKFEVIFQKYALKLIKNWKNWENSRKIAIFSEIFLIFGGHKILIMGKIKNLNGHAIMGGSGRGAPRR